MRNLIDESDGSTLTVWVHGGRSTVDLERIRELAAALDGALAAVRGASRALGIARLAVAALGWLAPLTGPGALGALDDVGRRGASLADLDRRLEELRAATAAAGAVYEEAENAARAVIDRQQGLLGRLGGFLLGTVLPMLGVPGWVPGAVVGGIVGTDTLSDARRGVPPLVNAQGHLRVGARVLGPLVNPTGLVRLERGWVRADETTPVEFLSSSLLDATGLDHFGGSLDVWAREPLTGVRHLSSIEDWSVTTQAAVPIGAAVAIAPLRSVRDVVGRMRNTAQASAGSGVGRIELVAQTGAAGATTWTVVLPGTREPFLAVNPQDNLSNVQLMGGERDDLLLAVKQALQVTPIAAGDALVFAGHSQGGIVAAELAADPEVNRQFDVAGVVTMGSPIGQVADLPAEVPVISLENVDDAIPGLDGLANTTRANQVTVQFDGGAHSTLFGAHDLRTYEAAYERTLAQGGSPALAALDSRVRAAAHWDDPAATARVYTFEFARTDRGGSLLDAVTHLGYERR